jgi:hypothetical protein
MRQIQSERQHPKSENIEAEDALEEGDDREGTNDAGERSVADGGGLLGADAGPGGG